MNDYSHKDFTGCNLVDATDMGGLTITGSCFAQEKPDTAVFPNGMAGVTFVGCNLDNCIIPPGNSVNGGSRNRIMVQDDGYDWIVDETNTPIQKLG